jgi:DNA-binding transcriptional LysR family regulator
VWSRLLSTAVFRKAALALGVQESAVSRRIRDLEDEIGATLFIRHHAGVCPTYAGHQFVGRARKAINQISYPARDVALIGRGEAGAVRIGIFSSLASGFLAELIQTYGATHGGVRLEIVEGGPSDHVPAIRQHRLDVAFLTGPPKAAECDALHLWNERIYVAMSKDDALADKEEVAWGDLQGRAFVVSEVPPGPEIYNYLLKHLADLGGSPDIERQAVYRDTLMQIVAGARRLTLSTQAA